ncbi:MAG: cobalamin biosynthesis protein [Janthinobacterium lividum]
MTVTAGIGCRKACPPDALVAVVRAAEALSGCTATTLAAPDSRAAVAREAARALGLPLALVPPDAMRAAQPRCVTRSTRALAETGVASVAEGAALAAAGPGAVLLLPRTGEGWATCALAG